MSLSFFLESVEEAFVQVEKVDEVALIIEPGRKRYVQSRMKLFYPPMTIQI
jgi:hypothetical protein